MEGRFDIPEEINNATELILEEIGKIGVQLTNGEVTINITLEDFKYFWKRVKEGTASSYSGIHYNHYMVAAYLYNIDSLLSKQITLVSQTGCPPDCWSYGLTVMLKN